jgi:hypothetical protein
MVGLTSAMKLFMFQNNIKFQKEARKELSWAMNIVEKDSFPPEIAFPKNR